MVTSGKRKVGGDSIDVGEWEEQTVESQINSRMYNTTLVIANIL